MRARVDVVEIEREAARHEIDLCDAMEVNRRGSLPAMAMTGAVDSEREIKRIRSLWRGHEGRFRGRTLRAKESSEAGNDC